MRSSYRFVVTGRVQGVGFRAATRRKAASLGLAGWVRNRRDGAVEGMAGGEAQLLEEFRLWLHQGPPISRVERVDWRIDAGGGLDGYFEILE